MAVKPGYAMNYFENLFNRIFLAAAHQEPDIFVPPGKQGIMVKNLAKWRTG
jgi:hypothetical protein